MPMLRLAKNLLDNGLQPTTVKISYDENGKPVKKNNYNDLYFKEIKNQNKSLGNMEELFPLDKYFRTDNSFYVGVML